MQKFDIIILGGGVSSLLLANKLHNFNILIIEKQDLTQLTVKNTQARAINFTSYNILQPYITTLNFTIIKNIKLYQQHQLLLEFQAAKLHLTNLAFIIDQIALQQTLFNNLKNFNNVTIVQNTVVEIFSLHAYHQLICATGDQYRADLIIGADGKNSWLAAKLQLAYNMHDYKQQALCANITLKNPHYNTARQYFLSHSIIGLLPLISAQEMAVIWSIDNKLASNYQQLDKFQQQLQALTHLDIIKVNSPVIKFTFKQQHLVNYIHNKIVFLGDAAHTVHPLAGLGLNMSIADSAVLADNLLQHGITDKALLNYVQNRRFENEKIIQFIKYVQKFSGTMLLKQGATILKRHQYLQQCLVQQALY